MMDILMQMSKSFSDPRRTARVELFAQECFCKQPKLRLLFWLKSRLIAKPFLEISPALQSGSSLFRRGLELKT